MQASPSTCTCLAHKSRTCAFSSFVDDVVVVVVALLEEEENEEHEVFRAATNHHINQTIRPMRRNTATTPTANHANLEADCCSGSNGIFSLFFLLLFF